MNCEQSSTHVFTDNQGRAWEQFNLNNQGVFLNQIPDVQSFTRTNPGWVLADNGYCSWVGQPPARIRTEMPVLSPASGLLEAEIDVPPAAEPGTAFVVFLVVVAAVGIAAKAGWTYYEDNIKPTSPKPKREDDYDPYPNAHIQQLPLSFAKQVVNEDEEDAALVGELSGVTETSPWLRDQLPPVHLQPPHTSTPASPANPCHTSGVAGVHQPHTTSNEPVHHLSGVAGVAGVIPDFQVFEPETLTETRLKTLTDNGPYNLYDHKFKTQCIIKTAIDLGLSKNGTVELFVVSRLQSNGHIETKSLVKGTNAAYDYFCTLYDDVKKGDS